MLWFRSKKPVVSESYTDYEKLVNYLPNYNFKQKIELGLSPSNPLNPLIEFVNQRIAENDDALQMLDINHVMQKLTSMTFIREMLVRIEEQTKQLNEISAHSEELGANANQVAVATADSAAFVEKSMQEAVNGGQKIREAIQFVERSFEEFGNMSHQVQEMFNGVQKIDQVVRMIAGIADQINLLALNAAIEAARAAEHGRGFAVVAEEVRKLAENTKSFAEDIQQRILGLDQIAQVSANQITSLNQSIQSGKGIMVEAGDSLQSIVNSFQSISQNINSIAAGNEEQSASIQESASSVSKTAESSMQIQNLALSTGHGLFEVSQAFQEVRERQWSVMSKSDACQHLENFKTGHLLWEWRVYNTILGFEKLTVDQVEGHSECRLSEWITSDEGQKYASLPAFKRLEIPHRQLHDLAREAIRTYEQGNLNKTEELLKQMTTTSREVVSILSQLQAELN